MTQPKSKLQVGGSRSRFRLRASVPEHFRASASEARDLAFEEAIRSIPRGKVATYGQIAEAAGYPRYHRAVARFLSTVLFLDLPWQRVVGAGGEIKTSGRSGARQRSLLKEEGVGFLGGRVDMRSHGHQFV
jgi:methylated-DNA-protein-cysteine methyltransferase-like protein